MLADLKRLLVLFSIAAGLAYLINQMRPNSLRIIYATPAQQLEATPERPGIDSITPPVKVVGIDYVIQAVKSRTHLIIDARPDLFWKIGHIPGAVSLPRKNFAEYYSANESLLHEAVDTGHPLLLYCADLHCPDAGDLARELNKRGFLGILLFEGGWDTWKASGQSLEAK